MELQIWNHLISDWNLYVLNKISYSHQKIRVVFGVLKSLQIYLQKSKLIDSCLSACPHERGFIGPRSKK